MISVSGNKWSERKLNNRIIEKISVDNNLSYDLSKLILNRNYSLDEINELENEFKLLWITFSKFKSKIVYVVLEKKPENLRKINDNDNKGLKQSKILDNALIRENFQRNYVQNELKKIHEEDLILVNDLDEIPNLEKFVYKKKITIFQQRLQYFKLNLSYPNYLWSGSKICKKKHLISPQWLRNVKTRKYPIWRPDLILSNKKYNNIEIKKILIQ